jgi:very-short-patch-repair endonuclease
MVARIAARQWGIVSFDELLACGLSARQVVVRVDTGRLHRVHRGVYAVGHAKLSTEACFLAAVKACGPDAVLSHFSAAALWGLVAWDMRRPEVTVPRAGRREHPALRVHQSRQIERASRHGIPLTTPARTVLDLASVLDGKRLRRGVREALALELVTAGELVKRLEPGRRGVARLARILATGHTPTRSELEDAVLDLIVRGGLRIPDVNVPLPAGGKRVVPDFRWPALRLVVEADGARWHDNPIRREEDAERQALLEADGERVLRVTWGQAVGRPAQTLARLVAAGVPTA